MSDPTAAICERAAAFPLVDEGTACTQTSFKACGQGFLYIGPQGGRYKAMFKLAASRAEAERLATERPDDFQVGSTAWVTARFSASKPLPKRLWQKWLDESYTLATAGKSPARVKKKAAKRAASKKTGQRKTPKRKTPKTKAPKKKAAQKKGASRKVAKQTVTRKKATKGVPQKATKKAASKTASKRGAKRGTTTVRQKKG